MDIGDGEGAELCACQRAELRGREARHLLGS